MRYPLDELIDKRSIIQLKIERIEDEEDKERLKEEFVDYTQAVEEYIKEEVCSSKQVETWHKLLYEVNGVTWDLEVNIRKGQIGDMKLEEVGKTTIAIRENNGKRVRIKSEIVRKTGIGFVDVRVNHASAKLNP